jgi:hypothetical protein
MPTTEFDDELIKSMPPGTWVRHVTKGKTGVVIPDVEYGQIRVQFDDGGTCFCYPINLQPITVADSRHYSPYGPPVSLWRRLMWWFR